MIQILRLSWDNWFSYGDSNSIDFLAEPLLQVKGFNGSGKSSIPLILQEVLFGSNSKGIKKQDLYNRYAGSKVTRAEVQLKISSKHYVLTYERSSKLKLVLFADGVDISKHTAPQTYKLIKDILGMDFPLFSTLTYQSTDSRLNFLTDTDVNRKRFLINLLNLQEYLDKQAIFKSEEKATLAEFNRLEGTIDQLQRTFNSLQNIPEKATKLEDIPKLDQELLIEKAKLENVEKTITKDNLAVTKNNKYKKELESITLADKLPVEDKKPLNDRLNKLRTLVGKHNAVKESNTTQISKLKNLGVICPTCSQHIDTAKTQELITEYTDCVNAAADSIKEISAQAAEIKIAIAKIDKDTLFNNKIDADIANINRLSELINEELPSKEASSAELKARLQTLTRTIADITSKANKALEANSEIEKHNASIDAKKEQLDVVIKDIYTATDQLEQLKSKLADIIILNEAFSMQGLISYKIENMITSFELEINKYLIKLSDGELLLSFKVEADKLNVLINSHGSTVGISSLSAGELAKVNIATLLSIRKMLVPINVLFLDEIAGVLDSNGKDALVELLSKEDINCLLVDHSFTHPLVPYATVVKENNIARLV